ncbi:Delta-sterol C-methyltransferase [Mycena venus]|uniref:Acyl-protein thioesterase 1 n=1 Tax=Mycena venus TaxID=2733690 RepID=A0A8H6YJI9_9AGAR|nr:Delta-sterol C-methyltransferase [Mycena venus]
MNTQTEDPVEIASKSDSDTSAVVVFLHNKGGLTFDIVNTTRSKSAVLEHVKWILPPAPVIPVTIRMQAETRAWFDVRTSESMADPAPEKEDEARILQSMATIDALLTKIVASGVDPSRIVLGGFSQGGAIALLTGLSTSRKLAGLIVLSARLPLRHQFRSMVSSHASSIPIFWGHGTADTAVSYELGRAAADYLVNEIGVPPAPYPGAPEGLDFHTYDGLPHYISDEELTDLASWLGTILPQ